MCYKYIFKGINYIILMLLNLILYQLHYIALFCTNKHLNFISLKEKQRKFNITQ